MSGPPPSTPDEHAALEALVEALEWQARSPHPLEDIAERLGLSVFAVLRHERKALAKLRREAVRVGLTPAECAEEPTTMQAPRLDRDSRVSYDLHGQIRKKLF